MGGFRYEENSIVIASVTFLVSFITALAGAEGLLPSTAATAARKEKLKIFRTIGSVVTFGHYEQDNNTTNGTEEIQWIVLDVQNRKTLLLSKYGLDVKPYNKKSINVTWETCTLRSWLNNDFLKEAFTPEEQSAILTTSVDNSSSQGYSGWSTKGGNNTHDKLFLLSYAEANKYLKVTLDNENNVEARVEPTAYANSKGAYFYSIYKTKDGAVAGYWWLRSPGFYQNGAAIVYNTGSLLSNYVQQSRDTTVRPALWIDLESDFF